MNEWADGQTKEHTSGRVDGQVYGHTKNERVNKRTKDRACVRIDGRKQRAYSVKINDLNPYYCHRAS